MVLPNSHATMINWVQQSSCSWGRMASSGDLLPDVDPYIVRLLGEMDAESEPNHLEPLAQELHLGDSHKLDGLDVRNENWSPYDWR